MPITTTCIYSTFHLIGVFTVNEIGIKTSYVFQIQVTYIVYGDKSSLSNKLKRPLIVGIIVIFVCINEYEVKISSLARLYQVICQSKNVPRSIGTVYVLDQVISFQKNARTWPPSSEQQLVIKPSNQPYA